MKELPSEEVEEIDPRDQGPVDKLRADGAHTVANAMIKLRPRYPNADASFLFLLGCREAHGGNFDTRVAATTKTDSRRD